MPKQCLFIIAVSLIVFSKQANAQQGDLELNRDSVVGWRYVSNPPNPNAVYKPIKSQYANGAYYSVWQQQASDMLINWIQQSYLPRGLVMRTIAKNDDRWFVDVNGPLQSYGVNFLGYETHFTNGKINLRCCEQGQRLVAGFNDFPGVYIKGFNPGGLHFFAEQAQFTSGDDDALLSKEGIDKRIQPNLYGYRTYLDHYHNNGQQMFKIGVVIAKNGKWPFKPVLVKDAVDYINKQLETYPAILQKNPYSAEPVKKALERLKPYYNEVVKLKSYSNSGNGINDGNGHYLLDPESIINGKSIDKTFPEYNILVTTTQQTIDQTKTDNPLWVYFDLTPVAALQGNPAKTDPKFGTGESHMVYSMLKNFNFDYVSNWLMDPQKMKNIAYTALHSPAKTAGNTITVPLAVSATTSAKSKDPYTILYEDFDGYEVGVLSAKRWHTYGHDGHSFENATLSTGNDRPGKWVSIPDLYTFFPDLPKKLPADFTVNYDVYFDKNISNKRTPIYIRMETGNYFDIHDINRNGFDFSLALSGEAETNIRFMKKNIDEKVQKIRVENLKAGEVAHINISVKGSSVSVSVNNKEVSRNDAVLPAGLAYKKIGWYCGATDVYLGNIYIKSAVPVQPVTVQEPQFAGVVKDPESNASNASAFESTPYVPVTLPKLDALPPINYPAGFKSAALPLQISSKKAVPALKIDYKFPKPSAMLTSISHTAISPDGFKKLIGNIKILAANKLQQANTIKIDNYLKSGKVTASKDIGNLAINMWMEGKPTAAVYVFCKALQADYSDNLTANNLASLLIAYGYAEQAITLLQYINNQQKDIPEVLSNLAAAYYNLGDNTTAMGFAEKCITKDSLNSNANKVAAFVHLNKAAQSKSSLEAEKAIGCLKQALKSGYDKEASDILSKIESNHQKSDDFVNTNFKEFPVLKRIQMPAMPTDLQQMISFDQQLELEKNSISKTNEEVYAAMRKIPEPDYKKVVASATQNIGTVIMMSKAAAIISNSTQWYVKMKKDLEDIFLLNKKQLLKKHNDKMTAIAKKYNDQLNKLEGGEGKSDEDEKMERLKKQRCEEYNKEQAAYLTDIAKLTNQFAQQSEYVSRIYCRDLANWGPFYRHDNSNRPFLEAQKTYLGDVHKILSLYTAIEPCIYPAEQNQEEKKEAKPKQWEGEYCANFKGTMGLGAAKIGFNCNSISISGGEGITGELTLNYNENGTFKDMTIGAGVGLEAHWGNKNIASLSAGASVMEYITIGSGANGSVSVTDWGTTAGVSAGTNVGNVGGEANILSGKLSAQSGVSVEGAMPDALKILTP